MSFIDEKPEFTTFGSQAGGFLRFHAHLTNVRTWIGPAWAVVCGVIASNGFGWQGADWLRLALLILLADACWGSLWAAIGSTDWATPIRNWPDWQFGEQMLAACVPRRAGGQIQAVDALANPDLDAMPVQLLHLAGQVSKYGGPPGRATGRRVRAGRCQVAIP